MTVAKGWIGRGGAALSVVAATLLALTLTGCGDRVLDAGLVGSVFGGGPPPDAPTPVRGMSGENRTFPNLATVPGRPTDVPTVAQRQQDIATLEQDRAQARAAGQALDDLVKPLPIPAKPDLTPGKPSQ